MPPRWVLNLLLSISYNSNPQPFISTKPHSWEMNEMRFLYILSAAGFALFFSSLYAARRVRPQKRTDHAARAMAHHAA